MGDSKILTEFRRLCDDYKAEYAIEGTVESFDTLYPVPPERLNRGVVIDSGLGKKYVDFWYHRKIPIEAGQKVIVVGKDSVQRTDMDIYHRGRAYPSKMDCVEPIAILSPENRWVQFSRQLRPSVKSARLYIAAYVLAAVLLMLLFIPLRDYILLTMNPLLAFLFLGLYVILLCLPCPWSDHSLRPRLYEANETTWTLLMKEIATRFGSKPSELKHSHPEDIPTSPS